jgi:hypothetical protein
MTFHGRVKNGQIALDQPAPLPEGALVAVQVIEERHTAPPSTRAREFRPIQMPGGSLSEEIVRDRK